MKAIFAFILMAFFGHQALAQTATVTATVTDPNGIAFAGASVTAATTNASGGQPFIAAGAINVPLTVTGTLSPTGVMSLQLTRSDKMVPAGTGYVFTICPLATTACVKTGPILVNSATLDITNVVQQYVYNLAITGMQLPVAYSASQLATPFKLGFTYFDVTLQTVRTWNGTAWVAPAGGGGPTIPGLVAGPSGGIATARVSTVGPVISADALQFGGIDGTNNSSSDSAPGFQAGINYACSHATGNSRPLYHIPAGMYYTQEAIVVPCYVNIQGDGAYSTTIKGKPGSQNIFTYKPALGAPGFFPGTGSQYISDMALTGSGPQSTGTMIELQDAVVTQLYRLELSDWGGIGIHAFGATERAYYDGIGISGVRWPFLATGDVNEWAIGTMSIDSPGQTLSDTGNYSYNVNAVNGVIPPPNTTTPVTLYPDHHTAIYVDGGEQVHIAEGAKVSIKSTHNIGCFGSDGLYTAGLYNLYCENFANNDLQSSVEIGYKETAHITSTTAITPSTASFKIDDAPWFPIQLNTDADASAYASSGQLHAGTQFYAIMDPVNQPGIIDRVNVGASSAQSGTLYLSGNSRSTHTWQPSSTLVLTPVGQTMNGSVELRGIHPNSISSFMDNGYVSGCSNTAMRSTWSGSPNQICGEFILGHPYDGLLDTAALNTGTVLVNYGPNNLKAVNPNLETQGPGWVKVAGNAFIDMHGVPQRQTTTNFPSANSLTFSYGDAFVEAIPYGTGTSQMQLRDDTDGEILSSADGAAMNQAINGIPVAGQVFGFQGYKGLFFADRGPNGTPTLQCELIGYPAAFPQFECDDSKGNNVWQLQPESANSGTGKADITQNGNYILNGNMNINTGNFYAKTIGSGSQINQPVMNYGLGAYSTSATPPAAFPGQEYMNWAPPNGGTYTLPTPNNVQTFTLFITSTGTSEKIATPNGFFFTNSAGANLGSTWTPPSPQAGAYVFQSDGGNWGIVQQPFIATAPTGTVVSNAVLTSGVCTTAASSYATCQNPAVNWTPALAAAPSSVTCSAWGASSTNTAAGGNMLGPVQIVSATATQVVTQLVTEGAGAATATSVTCLATP